jgi:hypothetical protein
MILAHEKANKIRFLAHHPANNVNNINWLDPNARNLGRPGSYLAIGGAPDRVRRKLYWGRDAISHLYPCSKFLLLVKDQPIRNPGILTPKDLRPVRAAICGKDLLFGRFAPDPPHAAKPESKLSPSDNQKVVCGSNHRFIVSVEPYRVELGAREAAAGPHQSGVPTCSDPRASPCKPSARSTPT